MRLQGKTALVTAAGQGIGRASALALAAEGAEVWATDVDAALLERYAGVANVRVARLDVLDRAAIERAVRDAAGASTCCSTAPASSTTAASSRPATTTSSLAFALNVRSQLWTIQAALPRHARRAAAAASSTWPASPRASRACPTAASTALTKAAVIGLTKSVAADYVREGIRCNALCPGTVDTPSLAGRINAYADPVAARQAFVDRQPMGRLAQAEEIAPMVVYLASDESRFATGQAFCVDGGMTI